MIELKDITKIYQVGEIEVPAVNGVSLGIEAGEFVAVMGASGSGKSTLLNLLGCLDRPTDGVYRFDGEEVSRLGGNALALARNRKIGFVFQTFNLLPRATALATMPILVTADQTALVFSSSAKAEGVS
ncbi:MAG: ABC transporter ATP-binding protein, partial [Verrucomicrobiota bacterium]|nr:ABC transporter ATP-binding protein [Verrucomicrobiota bacterium]